MSRKTKNDSHHWQAIGIELDRSFQGGFRIAGYGKRFKGCEPPENRFR
jgi:hypothetical protein